jgi:hypothetical protein
MKAALERAIQLMVEDLEVEIKHASE